MVLKPTILSITAAVATYTAEKTTMELNIFDINDGDVEEQYEISPTSSSSTSDPAEYHKACNQYDHLRSNYSINQRFGISNLIANIVPSGDAAQRVSKVTERRIMHVSRSPFAFVNGIMDGNTNLNTVLIT
ncbi:hypothetical protein INT43_002196 [Umbelopsis isabellina]|uniref:Uncharacterized protein n=1 Tax=Mortierella isabellina TaxID=91625 RepID=A0A8H7Q6R5_MORIS|nr:hypothetical protein INT43_002196 [Umbelopsis isabellina]